MKILRNAFARVLLASLLFLIFAGATEASISINPLPQHEYNIGDSVEISGSVFEPEDFSGELRIKVVCNNTEFLFPSVWLDIEAGKQKIFPSDFKLPAIIFSSKPEGSCRINLILLKGGSEYDTALSDSFAVKTDLKGSFTITRSILHSGQEFNLKGFISKLDGEGINGYADVLFVHDGKEYMAGIAEVTEGAFSYSYKAEKAAPGKYDIAIVAKDAYGNLQRFENVAGFEITNKLDMQVSVDKMSLMPGDSITIAGSVKKIEQELIDSVPVVAKLGNVSEAAEVQDGEFELEISIPENMASGEHMLSVIVKDEAGNIGKENRTVIITPVPTSLKLNISNDTFTPGSSVIIEPVLYDQAGALLDKEINIEIRNPDGDTALAKRVKSNVKFTLNLPAAAPPGEWTVTASSGDLDESRTFNVAEYIHASAKIDNQVITILNDGNVKYKEDVLITAEGDGSEFKIKKRKNLDVSEMEVIDLADELPSGKYKVTVRLASGDEIFNDVFVANGVETKRPSRTTYMAVFILLIVLIAVLFMLYRKRRSGVKGAKRIRKNAVNFRRRPANKEKVNKEKFSIKDLNHEQSVKEFRERVLREIKKTEERAMKPFGSKKGACSLLPGNSSNASENALNNGSESKKGGGQQKEGHHNIFSLFDRR